MDMYEKSGNQLALQYGGSELAHTIQTFNTTNFFDTWVSVKRYINNVFSDAEKQMSINLFLGCFKPFKNTAFHHLDKETQKKFSTAFEDIWELQTDYFLHMFPNRYPFFISLYCSFSFSFFPFFWSLV
jgi:hypothetical protein